MRAATMDTDERLRALWQRQQPPPALVHDLAGRVARHRRAVMARRALEVLLTVAAVVVFARPLWTGDVSPEHWLLMPFFAVFLIASWTVILRQHLGAPLAASESAAVYARLRQLQLRDSLRNLRLAERSAIALLVYATAAFVGAFWFDAAAWRSAAITLLAYSALWYLGTRWLVTRKRRAMWREYRAVRRIGMNPEKSA